MMKLYGNRLAFVFIFLMKDCFRVQQSNFDGCCTGLEFLIPLVGTPAFMQIWVYCWTDQLGVPDRHIWQMSMETEI